MSNSKHPTNEYNVKLMLIVRGKYQGLFDESKPGVYKWSVQENYHSEAAPGSAPGLIRGEEEYCHTADNLNTTLYQ